MSGSPPDPPSDATARIDSSDAVTRTQDTDLMAPSTPGNETRVIDVPPSQLEAPRRYSRERVLGKGGMGEVLLCRDEWIGREVAMKVIRSAWSAQATARARFFREASVQGQLEHPSVVPVYDIGKLEDQQEFFTMKRVKGLTLEQIITGLRKGSSEITAAFGQRKLLVAMSQVCLAVAYAHARGVVHRDLKPSNVMLGSFGEVYVLDWGVAKLGSEANIDFGSISSDDSQEAVTQAGVVVGTPDYMSPEQAFAETDITPASDVFALGAILFELVSLGRFRKGSSPEAVGRSLLEGPQPPSTRAPNRNIAPEIDAICMRALASDPAERFPSARAMHEALERYLDGERDAELRRELAATHLANARECLERAARSSEPRESDRAEGFRELGRALALDPSNPHALELITEALLGASSDLSPEAEAELAKVETRDRSRAAIRGSRSLIAYVLGLACLLALGVRSLGAFVATIGLCVVVAMAFNWAGKRGQVGPRFLRLAVPLHFALISSTSMIFGPLMVTPAIAVVTAASYAIVIRASRSLRVWVIVMAVSSVLLPYLAQRIGLFPTAYAFEDGVIKILPVMAEFPGLRTEVFLLLVTVVQLVLPLPLVFRAVDALLRAERQNFAQAWRLRQLVPAPLGRQSAPDLHLSSSQRPL